MRKKLKDMKVTTDEATQVINIMFSRLSATERNRILNMIDYFVLKHLKVPEKDVPWFNKKKKKFKDHANVLDLMRLSYAKLLNSCEKNFRNNVH